MMRAVVRESVFKPARASQSFGSAVLSIQLKRLTPVYMPAVLARFFFVGELIQIDDQALAWLGRAAQGLD